MMGSAFGYRSLAADKPAPPPQKDRLADTLILLDKQWWEAASKHDVDTLSKIYADDWFGMSTSPDNNPKDDFNKTRALESFRRARLTEVQFLTERRVVRLDEHAAIMTYKVKARTVGQPTAGVWSAQVILNWVQRDGGWFIRYSQFVHLPVPKEEPAPAVVPVFPEADFGHLTIHCPRPRRMWRRRGNRACGQTGASSWKQSVRSFAWRLAVGLLPDLAFDGNQNT